MGNGSRSSPYTAQNELDMPAVVQVSVCVFDGVDACITLSVPKKKGMWPAIMQILYNHNIQVVSATLIANKKTDFHCIHCKLEEDSGLGNKDLENLFNDLCTRDLSIN